MFRRSDGYRHIEAQQRSTAYFSRHSSIFFRVFGSVLVVVSGALTALAVSSTPASASVTTQGVSGSFQLSGIACPSATTCLAVGDNTSNEGVVVPITNGTPGTAEVVSGTYSLSGVACSSATACVAVGSNASNDGVVVPITNGSAGSAVLVSGSVDLTGVACPSSTTCEAVGELPSEKGAVVPITNGVPGSATTVSETYVLNSISCPSSTTCEAVGENASSGGAVVSLTNGVPGTVFAVSGTSSLFGVSCSSTATCEAVGYLYGSTDEGMTVSISSGTPGGAVAVPGTFQVNGVACLSATSCEAAGEGDPEAGVVMPITNGNVGSVLVEALDFSLSGIACPSSTTCEAVGYSDSADGALVTTTNDTVAFNSEGGSVVASLSGADGSSITLPSDTYPGYSFAGWFSLPTGGTKIGGAGASYTIPDEGATLYAQWTPFSVDYAAPSAIGSGTCADPADACSLPTALADVPSGGTVDLAAGTYQPASATSFTVSTSITLQPTTAGSTVILEGNGTTVLVVDASATALVSGITVEDGAGSFIGGIENLGTLTVVASTIADNTTTGNYGGGIDDDGTLTVIASTIADNTGGNGGGIQSGFRDPITIEDSTIADNRTSGEGGGIAAGGALTVEDSTIVDNSATNGSTAGGGGGIYSLDGGPVTLAADIIANQSAGGDCYTLGTVTDAGYNIADDGSCGLSATSSVSDSTVIDDYLGTLGSNGGSTQTVSLLATPSPTTSSTDPALRVIPSTFDLPVAVNGVSLACSVPDQRGDTRSQPCDIGAFELPGATVTFNANGAVGTMASEAAAAPTALTTNAFTDAGYTFTGWNTSPDGSGTSYADGAMYAFSSNATLYAIWVPITNLTLTYSLDGGTGATPSTLTGITYGTSVTLDSTAAPSNTGFTFGGWSATTGDANAGDALTSVTVDADTTVYAIWVPITNLTLTYSLDGGTGATPSTLTGITYGTSVTLDSTAAPSNTGFTFGGWSATTGDANAGDALTSVTVDADTTVYAIWVPITNLTLTYSLDGGTGATPSTLTGITYGTSVTLDSTAAPSNTGFTFGGWSATTGDANAGDALTSVTVDADTTVYAIWVPITNLTLTYSLDGGTGATPSTLTGITYGTSVTLDSTAAPSNTGFTFGGWSATTGDANAGDALTSVTVDADTTVYAIWVPITNLTLTYSLDGGTGATPSTLTGITYGTSVTLDSTAAPSNTGFTFGGWSATTGDANAGDALTSVTVDADTTVYAIWVPITNLTLTYSLDGGTGATPSTLTGITYGTSVTLDSTAAPSNTGFTFGGWSATTGDANAGDALTSVTVDADTTVYAIWVPAVLNASATVTFNAEGGVAVPKVTDPYGTAITLPTDTYAGHSFVGWFNAPSGGTKETSPFAIPQGGVTLYAHWTTNASATVTFNAEGGVAVPKVTDPYGTAITLPTDTYAGHSFVGWFNAPSGGTKETSPFAIPQGGVTLYAHWTTNASATVTFNAEGGVAVPKVTDPYGTAITLPTDTYAGHSFVGWFNAPSGGTKETSPFAIPQGGVTLYAHWTTNASATVTFNAEGGVAVPKVTDPYGTAITLPTDTYAGHSFVGWFNAPSGGTKETSPFAIPQGGVTLYAHWTTNASATVWWFWTPTLSGRVSRGVFDNGG